MAHRSLLFAVCLFSSAALADDPAWMQATAVTQATGADVIKTRSILSVAPHVADLEKVLATGDIAAPPDADGRQVNLTDGPTETLAAMLEAAKNKQGAVARNNPYPDVTLYLALYYNEVRRHDDALRVIEAGLKLTHSPTLGLHLPHIFSERADAYAQSKHFDEALATIAAGLTLAADTDTDRARFLRGRGFSLTELGELDEAEDAYKESLKLEPSNPLATREMAYIEHLKAGGAKAPTEQKTVPAKPNPNAPGAKPI